MLDKHLKSAFKKLNFHGTEEDWKKAGQHPQLCRQLEIILSDPERQSNILFLQAALGVKKERRFSPEELQALFPVPQPD